MITAHPFGALPDGTPVTCYRLGSDRAYADILDYGATIQALVMPDRTGNPVDVVLGYDTAAEYVAGTLYFGATVGRHANRIGGGRFTLNGVEYRLAQNSGPNHSHGGETGFDRRRFTAETDGEALHMHLISPDKDQGYPGTLRLTVTFSMDGDALTIRYRAETDRDTVVNLTNHSYFDLSGGQSPMGQLLRLDSDSFTENDENTLPTGRVLAVAGTAFDFTREKALGRDIHAEEEQLTRCRGYDHNFVLKNDGKCCPVAWLRSPETGICLTLETDMPGVQLYSGNYVEGTGKGGRSYRPRDGVCLETQFFPNAMAIDGFQKPILRAGEIYDHTTVFRFA